MQLAQGDLLFIGRKNRPKGKSEKVETGIIATGEGSGHTHRLRPGQQATLVTIAGIMYVHALKSAVVEHVVLPSEQPTGDHNEVTLSDDFPYWEVRRQREETPEGYRQVVD